jgi:hypothetical protein
MVVNVGFHEHSVVKELFKAGIPHPWTTIWLVHGAS